KYPQLGLDGESLLINQRDRLANGTRFYPFQSRSPVVRRVVRWADNFRCVAPVWPHLRGETYSRRLNMALTPLESKAALPKAKTYRLSLGGSLFLVVHPSGSKAYEFRYRRDGNLRAVVLGNWKDIGLKAAQKERDRLRGQLAEGLDP